MTKDFDEPEDLSTKLRNLSKTEQISSSSSPSLPSPTSSTNIPSPYFDYTSISPSNSPVSSPSPPAIYHPIPFHPASISPEYAPQTWHSSVAAPHYPYGFVPYGYHHHDYVVRSSSPYSESSLSPPHQPTHPMMPLAIKPLPHSDQSSLSPNSSTASPPPEKVTVRADKHSDKHRQADIHQCPDCGKTYCTFSGLSKHRQFHCAAGDGPKKGLKCKYCDKVNVSLGALKTHIRTHTLPCKCEICGKAFSRPWLLQGHIRTHTGEKPFSCTHCNRAFADRSNFRTHLQTHTDVKKYSCKNCNKTFSRMPLLTKHLESGCLGNANVMRMPTENRY